jgi:osmotically-inducible protein OsmY
VEEGKLRFIGKRMALGFTCKTCSIGAAYLFAAALLASCAAREPGHLQEPSKREVALTGTDRAKAQRIRQALVQDRQLSEAAHRVEIVVQNGKVTLRGPVRSEEEKRTVVDKAAQVVGDPQNVTDELTVKY